MTFLLKKYIILLGAYECGRQLFTNAIPTNEVNMTSTTNKMKTKLDLTKVTAFERAVPDQARYDLEAVFPDIMPRNDDAEARDRSALRFLDTHRSRTDRELFVRRLINQGHENYHKCPVTVASIIRTTLSSWCDWEIFNPFLSGYFNIKSVPVNAFLQQRYAMFDYLCGLLNSDLMRESMSGPVLIPAQKCINDWMRRSPQLYWVSDHYHQMQVKTLLDFISDDNVHNLLAKLPTLEKFLRRIDDVQDYRYHDLVSRCFEHASRIILSDSSRGKSLDIRSTVKLIDIVSDTLKCEKQKDIRQLSEVASVLDASGTPRLSLNFVRENEEAVGMTYNCNIKLELEAGEEFTADTLQGLTFYLQSIGIVRGVKMTPMINVTASEARAISLHCAITLPSHHGIFLVKVAGSETLAKARILLPNSDIPTTQQPETVG